MKLSVLMPVYNEAATLETIYRRVRNVPVEKEIIIVDDCSTDGTPRILKKLSDRDSDLVVIRHEKNSGKGAALRTGLSHVTGEITIFQDADLEYHPEEYPRIIKPIDEGKADVVYGSRFLGPHRVFMFWHHLGNKFLTLLTNLLYNTNITDMETCYKAFKTEYLKNIDLRSNRFNIEPEITAKIFKSGLRVFEVPISYEGRGYEEGKKIGWKDGISAIWTLLKYRFWVCSVGEETLIRISKMKKFNWWIYNKVRNHIGERVFEAGCGTGLFSNFLRDRERYVGMDKEDRYVQQLNHKYAESDNIEFVRDDLETFDPNRFSDRTFDTVLCINVLEHLSDDAGVLKKFHSLLEADTGKIVLIVPAFPSLYGSLDEHLDHKRRYSIKKLRTLLEKEHFVIRSVSYFNFFGLLGWWIGGKVLRRKILPRSHLLLYESFVPLFSKIETLFGPPLGLSILAICEKRNV